MGDISTIQVDAIVNSTNESLSDNNPVSNRIFARAGSQLKEEIHFDIKGMYDAIPIIIYVGISDQLDNIFYKQKDL